MHRPPSTNISNILETVWNLLLSLRPRFTVGEAKLGINIVFEESKMFRHQLSKSDIEIEYVDPATLDQLRQAESEDGPVQAGGFQ